MCAPISELPSYIITMVWTLNFRFCYRIKGKNNTLSCPFIIVFLNFSFFFLAGKLFYELVCPSPTHSISNRGYNRVFYLVFNSAIWLCSERREEKKLFNFLISFFVIHLSGKRLLFQGVFWPFFSSIFFSSEIIFLLWNF